MLFYGVTDENSLRAGIGYIIAGMLVRLWSNGYAIKNDKLTTSGPYAFVRNPLYLGTFLIALGFVIFLKMSWIGLAFIGALAFMYYKTIQGEQGMLSAKFGDAYAKYKAKVPAMIPSLLPYPEGEKWPFNLKRLIDSKEHKVVIWVTILISVFHLKSRILIEHKDVTSRTLMVIALIILLICLDVLYEINKKKIHQK